MAIAAIESESVNCTTPDVEAKSDCTTGSAGRKICIASGPVAVIDASSAINARVGRPSVRSAARFSGGSMGVVVLTADGVGLGGPKSIERTLWSGYRIR